MTEGNPFDRGKVLRFFDDVRELDETGQLFYPRMAVVYPTAICNYRCPGCLCDSVNNDKATDKLLDLDKFLPKMYDMREVGVRAVEFAGGGEPTLHPEFAALTAALKRMDVKLGLLTNGSRLGSMSPETLSAYSYMRVSLNGWNEATYQQFHGGQHVTFTALLDSIRAAIHLIRNKLPSLGLPVPVIGMKSLVSKDNYNHLFELTSLAQSLGFDYIQFKGLRNAPGELNEQEIEITKLFLSSMAPLSVFNSIKIYDSLLRVADCKMKPWSSRIGCVASLVHTIVDAAGDVWLCCYYAHRKESIKIGNLFQQKFKELWMGDRHKEVLKNVNLDECAAYDCRFCKYGEIFREALRINKVHVDFI